MVWEESLDACPSPPVSLCPAQLWFGNHRVPATAKGICENPAQVHAVLAGPQML